MRTPSSRFLMASALAALVSGCALPPDAYYDTPGPIHGYPGTIYRSGPVYSVPDRHDERAWRAHERRAQERAHLLRERERERARERMQQERERDRERMQRERVRDQRTQAERERIGEQQRARAERQRAQQQRGRDVTPEQRRLRFERSQDQGGDP